MRKGILHTKPYKEVNQISSQGNSGGRGLGSQLVLRLGQGQRRSRVRVLNCPPEPSRECKYAKVSHVLSSN